MASNICVKKLTKIDTGKVVFLVNEMIGLNNSNYIRVIRQLMVRHFNLAELKILVHDLDIIWDSLVGDEINSKVHSLISRLASQGDLQSLIYLLNEERPSIDWPRPPFSKKQILDESTQLSSSERRNILQKYIDGISNKLLFTPKWVIAHTNSYLSLLDKEGKVAVIKYLGDKEFFYALGLKNQDLSNTNLKSGKLRTANLGSADLSDSNLEFADLEKAHLWHATLNNAKLSYASLKNTTLYGADFSGATLDHANLERAYLTKSSEALTTNIEYNGGGFVRTNFSGASLVKANLNYANLYGANFSKAILTEASLSRTNLKSTILSEADFSGANLIGADFSGANLIGVNFSGADLRDAQLNNVTGFNKYLLLTAYSSVGAKIDNFIVPEGEEYIHFIKSLKQEVFDILKQKSSQEVRTRLNSFDEGQESFRPRWDRSNLINREIHTDNEEEESFRPGWDRSNLINRETHKNSEDAKTNSPQFLRRPYRLNTQDSKNQ